MKPDNWFLTGQPGIGKTTVVNKIANLLTKSGLKVGGIISPEIKANGERKGFTIQDLLTGRWEIMAHVDSDSTMKVGRYRVMTHTIDAVCSEAFPYAFQNADAMIIDEVGPMELYSQGFKHYTKQALDQPMPVLTVIHQKARASFVQTLRQRAHVNYLKVTEDNRDTLPKEIFEQFQRT